MQEQTWRRNYPGTNVEEQECRNKRGGTRVEEQTWKNNYPGTNVEDQECRNKRGEATIQEHRSDMKEKTRFFADDSFSTADHYKKYQDRMRYDVVSQNAKMYILYYARRAYLQYMYI